MQDEVKKIIEIQKKMFQNYNVALRKEVKIMDHAHTQISHLNYCVRTIEIQLTEQE